MPTMTMEANIVVRDVPPYLQVYQDGTIHRLIGTETTPPSLHPPTGVLSKDVLIDPESALSARLYHPTPTKKLPLVIYFHGGAFCISSASDPKYHEMLNLLVKEAQVILVSVDYRRAPENPLPAAYEDSWTALKWVTDGADIWLKEFADLDRVFLAGDSAGANICHHVAINEAVIKISGILMIHPYFWGEEAIGVETENPIFKGVVDEWWRFVCPSDLGCDDPWINPFVEGAPSLEVLSGERVLVCVAGNDILRERGRLYYKRLKESKWKGEAHFEETQGEDHVFHVIFPHSINSTNLIKRCAQFINHK